jgi:Protein of unknown function (DUF4058)
LSSKTETMKSPFIGMNPWLEGYLWGDVHSRLANIFAEMLAPQVSPKYVARIAIATMYDNDPSSEIGITYPDVELMERNNMLKEPTVAYGNKKPTEPTIVTRFKLPIEIKLPIVEIRDRAQNKLVTAIEILSPVNKRNPNLTNYRQKINELHQNNVNILEIDLLRRGTRPFVFKNSNTHYQMMLLRANTAKAAVWAINLKEKLPVLPVPLLPPDADAVLDLSEALDIIFERSFYHLSIDYVKDELAPPAFLEEDLAWIKGVVQSKIMIE